MNFTVKWEGHVAAKSEQKCSRVVTKLVELLGDGTQVVNFEKYWKDATLYEVSLLTTVDADEIESAVFKVLLISGRAASRWTVGVPEEYSEGIWQFQGWADDRTVVLPGVQDIHFLLTNEYAKKGSDPNYY